MKMMECREITRLMSRRLDASLRLGERITLRLHIAMCGPCRECNRQFELLHQAGVAHEPLARGQDGSEKPPGPES